MDEDNVINRIDEKSHKNTIYTTAVITAVATIDICAFGFVAAASSGSGVIFSSLYIPIMIFAGLFFASIGGIILGVLISREKKRLLSLGQNYRMDERELIGDVMPAFVFALSCVVMYIGPSMAEYRDETVFYGVFLIELFSVLMLSLLLFLNKTEKINGAALYSAYISNIIILYIIGVPTIANLAKIDFAYGGIGAVGFFMTPVLLALYGIERKTDSDNTPKQRIGILAVSVVTGICAIVYLLVKMQS